MKKLAALLLGTGLLLSFLFSRMTVPGPQVWAQSGTEEKKLQVTATIFPVYDWAREIIGEENDQIELTLLLDQPVDMHSYQPTAEDILKLSSSDLIIYVGGESDAWIEDVISTRINPDMRTIDLMEALGDGLKEEEYVEGMAQERPGGESEETEYDEHVWLSVKNAKVLVRAIAEVISELDPDQAERYSANTAGYQEKLDKLDAEYQSAADAGKRKTLLFADRFPFRYLTDDYGIDYYAAFPGCSAEAEASFETIVFLSGKLEELGLNYIFTIDGSDKKLAETVAQNTGAGDPQILTLDSMQSTVPEDERTWLTVMEQNLDVLREALNG